MTKRDVLPEGPGELSGIQVGLYAPCMLHTREFTSSGTTHPECPDCADWLEQRRLAAADDTARWHIRFADGTDLELPKGVRP